MHQSDSILAVLAQKVADAFPRLNTTERRIVVGTYRRLAEGKPVSPDTVARDLAPCPDLLKETLGSWPGVYYDDERKLIGSGAPHDEQDQVRRCLRR